MQYDYLMGMIKSHETRRIRAFNGTKQSNPEPIPAAFALLMPEIMAILTKSLNDLCEFDQGMVIFGLQPASGMISSNSPLEHERFIDGLPLDYHFCCTLDFFKIKLGQTDKNTIWGHTNSIVIDFTSGEVMDSDRFLSKVHFFADQGILYGRITKKALDIVWTIAKIKQTQQQHKELFFNELVVKAVA